MKESNNSDKSDKAPRSSSTPLGDGGQGRGKALFEKIRNEHVVKQMKGGPADYNVPTHATSIYQLKTNYRVTRCSSLLITAPNTILNYIALALRTNNYFAFATT
jgi:hypothetical protein